MLVLINGKEVEYQSDYPEGWKFSAGDPFKFPVQIGDQVCFVKRFEQKNPKNISGWELLLKLKGEKELYLSNIYDIKQVEEKGKDIYYIFYEYLEGNTLDKHVRTGEINLSVLSSSLFNAIRSLQKYDFWFADFCEKNIFCRKDGTFVLVDVDSTQRLTDMPDNEMYGNKDYWILVFKFYKEILNKTSIRLADINGISFNFLQIVFLILRLKLFYLGKRKDYNSTELYNPLPARLNDIIPQIREIFLKVFEKGTQPITESDVKQLENLVNEKIINVENLKETPSPVLNLPVIKEFTSSAAEVERGGEFTLRWQVENANKLELYKNGAMFRSLDLSQPGIKLVGFADGTRQQSSYQLLAFKDLSVAKSEVITISLKDINSQSNKSKKKKWPILAGVIVILLILIYFLFTRDNRLSLYLKENFLWQGIDSTIVIYGQNLPTEDKLEILVNDSRATIINSTADSLLVLLPKEKITTGNDSVFVFVIYKNKHSMAGIFVFYPPVTIKQSYIRSNSNLTLYGHNLDSEAIRVFMDNKEISIVGKSRDSIIVNVGIIDNLFRGKVVNIIVKENEKIIFSRNIRVWFRGRFDHFDFNPELISPVR